MIVPVHPGFGGTARPEYLHSMRALALTYIQLLDELDLTGVTVIGNSIGGWIAAEMAIHASSRISGVVLADAADRIYPPQHGEAFAKAIRGARLVVLGQAGHLPQLEAPSALLAAVLDFAR